MEDKNKDFLTLLNSREQNKQQKLTEAAKAMKMLTDEFTAQGFTRQEAIYIAITLATGGL